MNTNAIQSVLRIIAVASILVGAIMVSGSILVMVGYSNAVAAMEVGGFQKFTASNSLTSVGIGSSAMPIIWGAALYFASPRIASHIHSGNHGD